MAKSNNSVFLKDITNRCSNYYSREEKWSQLGSKGYLFWDFTLKPEFVTLVIEGKELYVHRDMLIKSSPVFQVMLESDNFIEKSKKKIELPDKRYEDVYEMLNYIYLLRATITGETNLEKLLDLSREYQVKKIKDICEKFLMEKDCSINMLIIAQDYDLNDLLQKCINYLGEEALVEIKNNHRSNEINIETSTIIRQKQLKTIQFFYKQLPVPVGCSSSRTCHRCSYIKSKDGVFSKYHHERYYHKRMNESNNSEFLKSLTKGLNFHYLSHEEKQADFTLTAELITLVVEGKELYVHRDMLIKLSPVFQVMLESDNFIEKDEKKIELKDKRYEDVHEMLNYIYPFNKITRDTNLESLLNLSREYQIHLIKDICEDFLLFPNCSIDMLIVAQEYNLKNLLQKCIDFCSETSPAWFNENDPRFDEINVEIATIIQENLSKTSHLQKASCRDWWYLKGKDYLKKPIQKYEFFSPLLWDFTLKPEFVTLVVEGKELHLHRDMLIKSSPVFEVMLQSDNFIKKEKKKIELPDKCYEDVHEMLSCIYPINYKIKGNTKLKSMLDLSREYQIQKINVVYERFLMGNLSIANLIVAQNYNLEDLLKKCISYYSNNPLISLDSHPCFSDINLETSTLIQENQLERLQSDYRMLSDAAKKGCNTYGHSCETCKIRISYLTE